MANVGVKSREPTASNHGFSIDRWFDRYSDWMIGLLVILFIVSGVTTLHNYGVAWDEGLGNLFFGEKNLRFLTSFDPRNLNSKIDLTKSIPVDLNLNLSPWRQEPFSFPALTDVPPTITKYIFSYWLKWLTPIDGFHIYSILVAGLFLWFLYRFAAARLGKFAAFLALLFLATFPRFWGDMHFNVKDVPETVFFGLTLMAYLAWYESPGWKRALLAGVLMGIAVGVKANGIFLPILLLAAIAPWNVKKQSWLEFFGHFRKYFLQYAIMVVSSVGVFILSWPFLYPNLYIGLKTYWGGNFRVGTGGGTHWQLGPLRQVVTTMPELMLVCLAIGLVLVVVRLMRGSTPFWKLLAVWLVLPILQVSVPTAVNFDGIRHFLEFVPAAALIAAYGLDRLIRWVAGRRWLPQWSVRLTALVLLGVNLVQIYATYYPNLHLYYNEFTGGLAGARGCFLGGEATDYWAVTYRPGMDWLDRNAPPDSKLVVLMAPWVADLEAPVFLRSDIQLVHGMPDGPEMNASKQPYYIMFILRAGLGNAEDEVVYAQKHGQLAYQIFVDGVPVLHIYKFGGN